MDIVKVFVGLDYHMDSVQVCVLDETGKMRCNRSVPNDAGIIFHIVQAYGAVQGAALEACCGAANLAEELVAMGWSVSLAHTGYVARMKQNPDKTDYGDARLLADLLRVGYLPKVWLAPDRLRRLRRLVRHRLQFVNLRRDIKLRIRALLRENRIKSPAGISPWTKAWLTWLVTDAPLQEEDRWMLDDHLMMLKLMREKISRTEVQLERWSADDAVIQKLRTMAGVGLVTATTLRAEVGHFDRFPRGKQLAKFCGVTPQNVSSGSRQADAGLIQTGNPQLRQVVVELAHRLINRGPERWRQLAAKLQKSGKKKNVVVSAIANRWVRWLHHQMQPEALAI